MLKDFSVSQWVNSNGNCSYLRTEQLGGNEHFSDKEG